MLDIPLGLYHTRSKYLGRSPMLLVCVTTALQWTHRYYPSGASMIFERYFLFTNVLHVNWWSKRHQFSSITASAAVVNMVWPTWIILALPFFTMLLIVTFCGTSCVEFWQNMRPGYGGSPHSSVGYPIMKLHKASLTFTNDFCYPPPGGLL